MNNKKIVIIGGGPAGMMAAINAAKISTDVTLVEKNSSLGRKLLITGKGRCNITNACELDSFLSRFSNNTQFLRDAFKAHFNSDLMKFFEQRGLKMKIERQKRVFPVTDKSKSVLTILENELKKSKVKVITSKELKSVSVSGGAVNGVVFANNERMSCESLIIATGGASYKHTGSNGAGINIVKNLGHKIIPLKAALVPLIVKQKCVEELEGLSLKNVKLVFSFGKKKIISEVGEMIFTRRGISGPLVLSLSGKIVELLDKGLSVKCSIDLKPGLSIDQITKRFMKDVTLYSKKSVKGMMKEYLPQRLICTFLSLLKIKNEEKISNINRIKRDQLLGMFKEFAFDVTSAESIDFGMVTQGGVYLKEVDPKTMQSKIVRGVYLAGEMLDIDGDTGGFNLQAAFSTGYLAGKSAATC